MNKKFQLAKNTIVIYFGKLCTQFVSFLLLPFYTALLSTKQYGAVDIVTTYVQLLIPIVFFQIDQAAFRFLIEKRDDKSDIDALITSLFGFVIIQSLFFSLVYFCVSIIFALPYAVYLYFNVLATFFASCFLQIARGLGDNAGYAVGSFISGSINVILNVIFITLFHMRADGMMLAMALGNVFCSLYILFHNQIYKYLSVKTFSFGAIKKMIKYSFPLAPNAISWWLVNASDRSVVLLFLGSSANGILAASHKFSTVITSFYNVFNISWMESASLHLEEDDGNEFFSSTIDVIYRLFSSCCICVIAFMPFLFPLLINEKFSDSYNLIPIYIYAALFNIIAGLYSAAYIAYKKTAEIAKTSIIAGVANVGIDLILIRWIGLYAAAISSAVAYGVMAVYRHLDVKKIVRLKTNWNCFFSSFFFLIIVSIAYYSGNDVLQIICFMFSIVFSIYINKIFIKKSICHIYDYIKCRRFF